MQKQLFLALMLAGTSVLMWGQTAHNITLQSHQDSLLVADAGVSMAFSDPADLNAHVLGGAPTARGGSSPYRYEWSPGSMLNNDTLSNPQIVNQVAAQQTYTLTVFDERNCSAIDSVSITQLYISNSRHTLDEESFKLYPNPASTHITIECPYPSGMLRLIDARGKILEQRRIQNTNATLDVQQLPPGNYVIEFIGEGKRIIQSLIITR